jgi:hypothetical protein
MHKTDFLLWTPVRLLERVECDDTKLDLMVIDPETR